MSNQIAILPPEEARKIAAGEVIDRPASIVREFIDNAIDAGGTIIEVSIEEGGVKRVEVSDNGSGLTRDDLELAFKDHATSKIRSLDDLHTARTLGFRGEALAATTSVSRLEILTSVDGKEGWLLSVGPGNEDALVESASRTRGASVRALNLFDTIPARKRFLKREGSEALICKHNFIEKALAFPGICFRFVQDGKLKLFFPAVENYKIRFATAILSSFGGREAIFLHQITALANDFSLTIVIGGPEVYRSHRREQFIFANGRRINDYSLQQAMEYGVQGAFPNATHPVGAIFLEIKPYLADFNIHPAKREARFACAGDIHHLITSTLRSYFRNLLAAKSATDFIPQDETFFSEDSTESDTLMTETWIDESQPESVPWAPQGQTGPHPAHPFNSAGYPRNINALLGAPYDSSPLPALPHANGEIPGAGYVRYVGRVFGLFILVEKDDIFYAIDQHAAHERILYDKLLHEQIMRQELLVPIPFETETPEDDAFLTREKENLKKLGIIIDGGVGEWHIDALPVLWRRGDADTVHEILNLRTAGENMAERWAATIVCHSAIRDGDRIDDESALALAEEALTLQVKTCPHGRPILFEIKKDEFFRKVRRI
jgi:DNA mismatch repair protein MutL